MQIDVIDLCALLECIGLKIQNVEPSEIPPEQDAKGGNTVTISCNFSGLRVTMNSTSTVCTCPSFKDERSSSCWQISSCTNGVIEDKTENGKVLLGSLSEATKKIMTRELHKVIQFSRTSFNQNEVPDPRPSMRRCALFDDLNMNNGASSFNELNLSPTEERRQEVKVDTPTRYRSLDALTNMRTNTDDLPAPGLLMAKQSLISDISDTLDELPEKAQFERKRSFVRQDTYTIPIRNISNVAMKSKTSSPIGKLSDAMMQDLLNAEEIAIKLRDKLASLVRGIMTEEKDENYSIASLNLDVSKISVSRSDLESKHKVVSSPNLSDCKKRVSRTSSIPKRSNSKSMSNLARQTTPTLIKLPTKLKQLSPNLFRKKEDIHTKNIGEGVFRKIEHRNEKPNPRIAAPVIRSRLSMGGTVNRTPTNKISEPATSSSTTKKKMYSHVKSTIPKPTYSAKKE